MRRDTKSSKRKIRLYIEQILLVIQRSQYTNDRVISSVMFRFDNRFQVAAILPTPQKGALMYVEGRPQHAHGTIRSMKASSATAQRSSLASSSAWIGRRTARQLKNTGDRGESSRHTYAHRRCGRPGARSAWSPTRRCHSMCSPAWGGIAML